MATKLSSKSAGICTLMAVLCLAAVLRAGGAEVIELRNERVSLRFGARSGMGLTGISDLATGRELLEPPGVSEGAALWNLRLFQGTEMPTIVNSLAHAETRHNLTRVGSCQKLELFWDSIAVGNIDNALEVRVTIELEDGSPLARWQLATEVRPPWRVWSADFPGVSNVRDLGDDYLAVPNYMGRIVHDPAARLTPSLWHYPGKWSMQFVAAWGSEQLVMLPPPPLARGFRVHGWVRGEAEDEAGLFMMCEDSEGWHKVLALNRTEGSGYGWSVEHFPALPDWPVPVSKEPVKYCVPYPVVLGVFNGTAEAACDIYRRWALLQPWAQRGPISRPHGPEWTHIPQYVRDTAFWGKFYHEPAKVAPELASYREYLRVPMMTHYYRYYLSFFDDNNPEYSPTDPYVRQGVRDMHATGVHVMPYICGSVWDMDTESYRLQGGARGAVRGPGNEIESWLLAGNSPSAWMNPAAPVWQGKLLEVGRKLVGDYGVDGLYFDVLPAAGKLCYDPKINPPHGGNYWAQGNRDLLERMRWDLRGRQPDVMFTGESFSENYIDLMDAFLTLDTTRYGWKVKSGLDVFPLLSMVYHDHTITFGSDCAPDQDLDNFAWQMGLNFVWGSQLMYSHAPALPAAGTHPETDGYLREAVRATYQVAGKFLTGGRWIQTALVPEERLAGAAPAAIISPEHRVRTKGSYLSGWTWIGPAVLGSAWRAPDGTLGFVLTNISDKRVEPMLRLNKERLASAGIDAGFAHGAGHGKLWRVWPLPVEAVLCDNNAAVIRLPLQMDARTVIVFQLGGETPPQVRPLDEIAWRMVEAAKDGSFPDVQSEGSVIWGCEDALVGHEIIAGPSGKFSASLSLLEEATDGVKPRHVSTQVRWGVHEGYGKPRAPADKPFHVLQATPFRVESAKAVIASVRSAKGVVWGELKSEGRVSLFGPEQSVILVKDAAGQSEAGVYKSAAELPAGAYRFVAVEKSVDAGLERSAEAWKSVVSGGVSLQELAAFTRIAADAAWGAGELGASWPEREQQLVLGEMARGVTHLATGYRVWPATTNDWLLPTVPLEVKFAANRVLAPGFSMGAAALVCMDRDIMLTLKVEPAGSEGREGSFGFSVATTDPLLVERLVPLGFRVPIKAQGHTFATGALLWLNLDRPLMLKFDLLETLTAAGAASQADLRVRNLSPHVLDCTLDTGLPAGWRLGADTPHEFRLQPFKHTKVPLSVITDKTADAAHGVVEVAVGYATNTAARVHDSFKVWLIPRDVKVAEIKTTDVKAEVTELQKLYFRYRMVLMLPVKKGAKVELDLNARAGAASVRFWLRSPNFEELEAGTLKPKESRKIAFTAAESGTYLLEALSSNSWTVELKSATRVMVLASEAVPLSLIHSSTKLRFTVKPQAKTFEIKVTDGGIVEPVGIKVLCPDGSEAFAREGNWDDRWITINVPPGADRQGWSLEIDPKEDVSVQLRGGAIPSLSP